MCPRASAFRAGPGADSKRELPPNIPAAKRVGSAANALLATNAAVRFQRVIPKWTLLQTNHYKLRTGLRYSSIPPAIRARSPRNADHPASPPMFATSVAWREAHNGYA